MKRETYLKGLLAFLLLMVGANPSWADRDTTKPVYSPTTGESYDDVISAYNALVTANSAGDWTIELYGTDSNKEIPFCATDEDKSKDISLKDKAKTLSIVPMAEGLSIKPDKHTRSNRWFLVTKNTEILNIGSDTYALTIKGYGSNSAQLQNVIRNEGGSVKLNNVTFTDFSLNSETKNNTTTEGFIYWGSSTGLTMKNVSISNSSTLLGAFIKSTSTNNDAIYLSGAVNLTDCTGNAFELSGRIRLKVSSDSDYAAFSTTSPLLIKWNGSTSVGTAVVVKVAKDNVWKNYFALNSTTLALNRDNEDLKIATGVVANTTQSTAYVSLADAIAAVAANDVLSVIANEVEINAKVSPASDKPFSIVAGIDNATIKKGSNFPANTLLFLGKDANLTLGSADHPLVIDGDGYSSSTSVVEASGNNTCIKNVTFKNFTTSNEQGIITHKSGGTCHLKDITFNSCTNSATTGGIIYGGRDQLWLDGGFAFTNCSSTANIYNEAYFRLESTATLTNTNPITVKIKAADAGLKIADNGNVIANIGDYLSNFSLLNDGYELRKSGNNAVLKKTYSVTIADGITNGTVTADKAQAASGETITLTPTPTVGYKLSAWDVYKTGESSTKVTVSNNTFTMPAYAVTVSASFAEIDYVSIGDTEYPTLEAAVTAAAADATIIINKDVTVTSAISFTKALTIKPAAANVKILRGTDLGNNALFTMGANVTVTIGDADKALIIDGQTTEFNAQLINVPEGMGTLNLVNTTIQNVISTNSKGIAFAKKASGISLNGVTFNNCQATAANAGLLYLGSNDAVVLQGNNVFSSCTGYNFFLEGRINVADAITTAAANLPYTLYIGSGSLANGLKIADNGLVVLYIDKNDYAAGQFAISNTGYEITYSDNGAKKEGKLTKANYTVTLPTDGTVTVNKSSANYGDDITVTVTVPAAKQLATLTYTPEGESAIDIKAAKAFTMPAKNVTITVTYVDFVSYDHPIMLHKQADIDRVKGNIGYAPIKDAWAHLQASNFAQASYTAHPVDYLKRMDAQWSSTYSDYNNYTYAMRDANAAYQLALRYQLSGDETYAAKAAAILDAWATTNQGVLKITGGTYTNDIPDPNEYLILIQGHQFANAAELLNGYSWSGKTAFVTWMGSTFYDLAHTFLTTHHETSNPNLYPRHYWMNWDLAAMTAILSYGILADDQAKVAEALDYYKTSSAFNGYMGNAIGTANTVDGKVIAQSQESGRDQGHTMLDVALLGAFCQMATNVSGEDYFVKAADGNGNALQMAEYVAKYNLQKDDLFPNAVLSGDATDPTNANYQYEDNPTNFPFTDMNYSYSSTETINHTANSPKSRGDVRPVWELFYRYAKQNSKDATFTEKWVNQMRTANAWGDGGAGDYGSNSNGFDQLGYGTLMYADPTNTDGQDAAIDETDYPSPTFTIGKRGAVGDTYVRSGNGTVAGTNYGTVTQMEVYTTTAPADFKGLLSFKLPAAAVGTVQKAQLRLVTKRRKNTSKMNIYKFVDFDETTATYTSVASDMTAATSKAALATFTPKGQLTMDVTSDGTKDAFNKRTLEDWTNRIDLTSYVQSLSGRNVNLLLSDVSTADTEGSIQFFTKEWNTDLTSNGTTSDANGITAAAADLVPQLIVIYTASGTPGVFNVGGDSFATLEEALEEVADGGTITVTGNATVSARTTFTKNVTLKGQTGSEVISRGTSSAAMKQSVLFKANSGKTVTFDGIVFDDNNATVGQPFEVDNNTFVLKNMTIKNSKSTSANGVISMKKGTLTVEGITFTDCAISNAYLRAAAGTLNFSGNYNLTNSTGNHFRLGNVALDATTLPAGITYKIEVEDAAATITNVSDASKFELTSDGYLKSYNSTTKVISFTEEGDGQDTAINEASYSGKTISKRGATGDTYVRSDNMTRKNGSVDQMEIRTNADGSNDFVGLISFKLPAAAIGNVTKAQLRLVTKQKKTNNRIRLYAVGEFDEKEATYETMSSAIAAARGISLLAKFKPKGEYNMDVTKDAGTMSDDSKNLSAWTNYIDLTSYLNSLTTADVNLMLTESEGDGKAIQFFTKERTDAMETSVEGNAFNAASADLVPQLIVVFAEDTSNRKAFYISGEGSYDTLAEAVEAAQDGDEIIVTKNASVSARVTFTKNVTLKAESGVVLSRSAEEAAMKQSVLFKANSGKTVTFDGIVFDDNNATVGQPFEVDNNTFVLKNMTIKNSKSTSANGVISMKKGTLTVEGITFTDCAISNAYLRAAAGTLNFSGNYNLTNSTGNHFRLGSVALNGGTLPAIQGTWRIEVESDGASITNVTDASKFTLASVGYTMSYANNTITFTAEGDGQDTSEIVVPEGYNKSLIDPIIDTYVRKGNASNNGQRMNMEVYTYQSEEEDLDFAGLMAFKLPDDLTKSGAKLEKAQLRLVTKRVKGSRIIDMYQIYTDFDEEAIYDQMEKRLTDAREGGYMRRFQAKGQAGMDIEADSLKLTDEYKDIKNWTNLIDLTDVVQNVMFDDGILRFALSAPVNGKDPKQFYTSEAETFKNAVMQVSYADLIPQLILVYSPGNGASTLTAQTQEAYPNIDLFLRKGSTSDNSSSEVMEVYTFNDGNQDQDFIGLMSFNLDNEVASARSVVRARSNSDLELFNATLRLVTKRLKGEREMNVFLFDTPFGANSTYSQLESAINEARTNGDYVTFKSAGMVDKDVVTDDGLTGDYSKTITAWTNYIDVTNLVKKSDRSTFNLMLSAPDNARTPKHYFSGDAESFTNTNYSNFIVSSDELVPLLTITYRNPLYTDIEETIVVPVKKEHIIYDLRGNRVQNAGKGIYIIDGKKVLKK